MELFGRYRLLHQIAVGGMGEIFLARSASLDGFEKDLVIKRILRVHGDREHFVSMFLDEARVSMSLSHQNIVQVFDFGETDGRYYIAMEHVYGTDCRRLLRIPSIAGGGMPPGLALYIMREVSKGLDYAHNKRGRNGEPLHLVHRDISPDNILVSFDGGVKITDFGIAKVRGQVTQLEPGAIVGKVHYMAPEIADGRPADARSDVFSCGAVLWELLVGHRMYEQSGESNEVFFERIRQGRIEKPSDHNRDVPRRIEKVVMRALAYRPEDRFGSARELGNELHELLTSKYRDSDSYELQSFLVPLRAELRVIGFDDLEPSISSQVSSGPGMGMGTGAGLPAGPGRLTVPEPQRAAQATAAERAAPVSEPTARAAGEPSEPTERAAGKPSEPTRPAAVALARTEAKNERAQPAGRAEGERDAEPTRRMDSAASDKHSAHSDGLAELSLSPGEATFVSEPQASVVLPEVKALGAEFEARPSVWTLVRMGELCAAADQHISAVSCYRVAAVKFAQHGLLAQSLLCAKLLLEQQASVELVHEIGTLPSLVGRTDETILPYLFRTGGVVEELLAQLIVRAKSAKRVPAEPPPLIAHLSRDGFAQLARLAPLERFAPEDKIVVQGDKGETMYLILSGRAIVHVTKPSGEKINVASLAAGDFFGENSFFSGARRNATVEAVEESALIEIGPLLYDRVMRGNPKASSILLRFYKERIVDHILATSPTFGLLSGSERREVLAKLALGSFEDGTEIVGAGGKFDAVYLIKRGSAMIKADEEEIMRGPGSILGALEVAEGRPSAASVVAVGEFEAFALDARALNAVLDRVPERRAAWLRAAQAPVA